MAELLASYTHLCPFRRQVLLLHVQRLRVRLLSDPMEYLHADSGWHGRHNWFPGCDSFSVWDFRYHGSLLLVIPRVALVRFGVRFVLDAAAGD